MSDADGADWPPLRPLHAQAPCAPPLPRVSVGDRIRIIEEGVVEHIRPLSHRGHRLMIRRPNGSTSLFFMTETSTAKVEVLAAAYVNGGVYRDADGAFFQWSEVDYGWRAFGREGTVSRNYPETPLERVDG